VLLLSLEVFGSSALMFMLLICEFTPETIKVDLYLTSLFDNSLLFILIPLSFIPQYRRITQKKIILGISPHHIYYEFVGSVALCSLSVLNPFNTAIGRLPELDPAQKLNAWDLIIATAYVWQSIEMLIGNAIMWVSTLEIYE
jgi:hypothetical protein